MKRKLLTLAAVVLAVTLLLASCGAGGKFYAGDSLASAPETNYDSAPMAPGSSGGYAEDWVDAESPEEWTGGEMDAGLGEVAGSVRPQTSLAEKIIYTADVDIETVDFDAAVDRVQAMLDTYGAFLESSSVSGKTYDAWQSGRQTYRTASFVIRVPVESFDALKDNLGDVGSVLNTSVYTENITERYYDVQARVDSYRIEQERLMDMLSKCETVTEMLEIEARLSDVRYELESFESTLRNWQNQVDYSTVRVDLREVEVYTKVTEPHRTYWQQIGDGLQETLEDLGEFFKDLFKDFVVNLPIILILAVIAAAVIVLILRAHKKRRVRREAERRTALDAAYTPAEPKDGQEK